MLPVPQHPAQPEQQEAAIARPKRNKAKSPADIAAEKLAVRMRDFQAVNLPAGAAALTAHNDVVANHAERDKEDGARRMDAFLSLRDGMEQGAYDAARRLEKDIATRHGEADKGRPIERVDGDSPLPGHTDAMVEAGRSVDAVLNLIGPRDKWLLSELIRPTGERKRQIWTGDNRRMVEMGPEHGWRGTVAYITGEENPVAQGAAVRSACANLAVAYEAMDNARKRLAA